MTDWGVPDWRDADAYPAFAAWTIQRWHWEFIRRDDAYREQATQFLNCMDCGWTADEQSAAFEAYFKRWGYCDEVLNPVVSEYPDDRLKRLKINGVGIVTGSPEDRKMARARLDLSSGEIGIRFNCDRPLGPQLAAAKKMAEQAQIARHGYKLGEREQPDKWPTYLRALDARAAGASWSDIAAFHPHSAVKTSWTGRDTHDRAIALRNKIAA